MRRAKERSFRYYDHEGPTNITNFPELDSFILTHYNKSKMELMRRTKQRSFRHYHHEGLTTITNFTELNPFIRTPYNRSKN